MKEELGYIHGTVFNSNFVFIGKHNSVFARLPDTATTDEIDKMMKRTRSSFHGLFVKKDSDLLLLNKQEMTIDLNEYFLLPANAQTEIIAAQTDSNILDFSVSGKDMVINRGDFNGISTITIRVNLLNSDLFVESVITVINASELYEDFEIDDLSYSHIDWTHSGQADWFISEEESFLGSRSLRSGEIGQSQTSEVLVNLDLKESGTVVFAYKTSSRPFYNKLNFYIDGLNMGENETPYLWSGETDWRLVSYTVRGGRRQLRWEYEKSPYHPLYNRDAVWIDIVVLPDKINEKGSSPTHDKPVLSAYPNPFNPVTSISFDLSGQFDSELSIFDVKGRQVATVFKGRLEKGSHSFELDGSGLSSGIYYSVLRYGNNVLSSRLILAK